MSIDGATPQRRSTMHEVARLAGVSHQTVSRYLHDSSALKDATRERVERAIADLAYRPNPIARSMRTRRTGRVGIVVPAEIGLIPARLLQAAADTARAAGYGVELVTAAGDRSERTARACDVAAGGQVDGLLSLVPLDHDVTDRSTVPIVAAGDYDDDMRAVGGIADGTAAREIVGELARLGHRTLLCVTGPPRYASARNRLAGYEAAVAELGLVSYGVVEANHWDPEVAARVVAAFPDDCPVTAVVTGRDLQALAVIRAAAERGWSVPGRLSVTGWDDEEFGRHCHPRLTTVAVDREAHGRSGMVRLVAAINGTPAPPPETARLTRLVIRDSIGPAPVVG